MVDSKLTLIGWLLGEDRCVHCHAPTASLALCGRCQHMLPWNDPACAACAMPLDAASGEHCVRCARDTPPWSSAHCALQYAPPVKHWVYALKYDAQLAHARSLGQLLALSLRHHGFNPPELLIPVPLHPARQRQRGFNQSLEIARRLSSALRIPLRAGLVRRVLNTADQTTLSAAERRRNLRAAFQANPRALHGRHVAVVDDVLTTGATAGAMTRALRGAGATSVQVWCCARTP